MITVSAVGLLKMVLYILAIYFIIKILARLFMPLVLKMMANKVEKTFGEQFKNAKQKQQPKGKPGETVIDKIPPNSKSTNDNVGDYVDYEEID